MKKLFSFIVIVTLLTCLLVGVNVNAASEEEHDCCEYQIVENEIISLNTSSACNHVINPDEYTFTATFEDWYCLYCHVLLLRRAHTFYLDPTYYDEGGHFYGCYTCNLIDSGFVKESHTLSYYNIYDPIYHADRCAYCLYTGKSMHFYKGGTRYCFICGFDRNGPIIIP